MRRQRRVDEDASKKSKRPIAPEDWLKKHRRQGEDHGIRPSRLQKGDSRVPIMREIARDLGETRWERELGRGFARNSKK